MFDSVYSIALSILKELGGDDTVKYDSTYSIALAILDVLGGDTTKKYDSVYSILLDIYKTRFGTDLSGMDSSYSILNEINKAFDPSDTSKYDSSYETLIAISEHMVPAGYVFEIDTDPANTVIINGVQRTSAQFETGTEVSWSVSRTGYVTQSGTYTMGEEDYSLTVTLVAQQYTLTISPDPIDADVVMNGQTRSSITVAYGTVVTWSVSKTGYVTQSGSTTVTQTSTQSVTLSVQQYTFSITATPAGATVTINGNETNSYTGDYFDLIEWSVEASGYITQDGQEYLMDDTHYDIDLEPGYTFSIVPDPIDATVMIDGEERSSIFVEEGTEVTWEVSAENYDTDMGSYVMEDSDHTEYITLNPTEYTVTITPDPADATVVINGDETDTYTAPYGELIEWEVSKTGYDTEYGSFTLTEDTDLTVTLVSTQPVITFNKGDSSETLIVNGTVYSGSPTTITVNANVGDVLHWESYRRSYSTRRGDVTVSGNQTVNTSLSEAPFVAGTATSSPTLRYHNGSSNYVNFNITYDSNSGEFYSSEKSLANNNLYSLGDKTNLMKLTSVKLEHTENIHIIRGVFESLISDTTSTIDHLSYDGFYPGSSDDISRFVNIGTSRGYNKRVLYINNWDLSQKTSADLQQILTYGDNGNPPIGNIMPVKDSQSGSVKTINDYPDRLREVHMNLWSNIPTPMSVNSGYSSSTIPAGSKMLLYRVTSGSTGNSGWNGNMAEAYNLIKDAAVDIYAYGWTDANITKLKNTFWMQSGAMRNQYDMYWIDGAGKIKIWIDGTHYWYWDIEDQYTSSSFGSYISPSTTYYWYPCTQWTLVDTTA